MILYNLKSADPSYRITKFDDDLNAESSYLVDHNGCECPQGHKPTCRHRKMLPIMLDRADSHWFYCFDDKQWYDPTGDARYAEDEDEPELIEAGAPAPDLTNNLEAHSSTVEQGPLKAEVEGSSPSEPAKLRRLR